MRPGNGDGTFGAPVFTIPGPGHTFYGKVANIQFAQAADLNGDGFPDLVAGDTSGNVALLNQRDGTFLASSVMEAPAFQSDGSRVLVKASAVGVTTASGHPDVVEVWIDNLGNTNIETFLNDGTGNFPVNRSSSYQNPSIGLLYGPTIALADVNNDGKLDLLIEKQSAGNFTVEIDLGNGDGTFAAPTSPAPGFTTASSSLSAQLLVTSLTGDPRRQDIVVTTSYGPYLAMSNGDGTYQPARPALPNDPIAIAPGAKSGSIQYYMGVQTADIDGDGKQDLIVSAGGGLAVYLGNGDGTFGPVAGTAALGINFIGLFGEPYGLGKPGQNISTVAQIALADWNGDGKADFAFADMYSGYVGIGFGHGDGSFATAPLLYSESIPQVSPLGFFANVTADMNGDGIPDVLGYSSVDGSLISALADGKGGFIYKQALAGLSSGLSPLASTTGDFNNDGKTDFLEIASDGSFGVVLSNGDGTVQKPLTLPFPNQLHCQLLDSAAGDLNGDGKLDLVFAYSGDAQCNYTGAAPTPAGYVVALGDGDGTFSSDKVQFYSFGSRLQTIALAHYHGASHPLDLVVADAPFTEQNGATVAVSLLSGKGDGTFGPSTVLDSGHTVAQFLTDDYNHDGKPDLTLIASTNYAGLYPIEGGVFLLPGNGDGTFGPTLKVPGSTDVDLGAYSDVNGDGIADLILSDNPSYQSGEPGQVYSGVSVLLGTGIGTFAPPINYPSAGYPLLLGNFLGDNTISMVAGGIASGFFMNQGGTSVKLNTMPSSIQAGDTLSLDAFVTPTLPNRPAPTGNLTYYDGQTAMGSVGVNGGALAVTTLSVGTHTLTAAYSGDSNFQSNTSAAATITVTSAPPPPAPDYALTVGEGNLGIIAKGQSATVDLYVAANSSLNASVTFTCSGLPADASCTVSPAAQHVSPGQTATAVLTVNTTAATSAARQRAESRPSLLFGSSGVLGALLCFTLPLRIRGRRSLLFLLTICFALAGAGLTGCGGSSAARAPSDPGTPTGNGNVTVTATATSGSTVITHAVTLSFVVQ